MSREDWPKPPIWSEYLPLIRELLTPEDFEQMLTGAVNLQAGY